jgi:hypothetical protein
MMDKKERSEPEMTQQQIVKEVQRAAMDGEGLHLSEDAAELILETIKDNEQALRFLARI